MSKPTTAEIQRVLNEAGTSAQDQLISIGHISGLPHVVYGIAVNALDRLDAAEAKLEAIRNVQRIRVVGFDESKQGWLMVEPAAYGQYMEADAVLGILD